MTDERVWLRHKETGGYFYCPAEAIDDWLELGFAPSDPPEEHNPVVAELLAWQAAQQVVIPATSKSKPAVTVTPSDGQADA